MPFQYQGYRNPYVGTIAELLQKPGEIEAQRAQQVAQAQARSAEATGQAWAGAAQQIGQQIGAMPGQIAQAKTQAQQSELTGLKVDEAKQTAAFKAALGKVMQDTPHTDEDGASIYNIPAISQQLASAGFGAYGGEVISHLAQINQSVRAERAAKLDLVQKGARAIIAAGNDPLLANNFLDTLEKNGSYPKDQIQQYRDFVNADPDNNLPKLTSMLAGPAKIQHAPAGSTFYNETTGEVTGQAPDPKADAQAARDAARQTETERHNKETERISGLTEGRAEAAQRETARHNGATEGIERQKAATAAGDVTDLTPEGLDAAALNYAKTGALPPLGMGDKQTRKKIINRAAEMMPGLDIASAKADYDANKGSLVGLQKMRDAIGSFENTAKKNIKLFLDTAGKVVDTGSPLANTLARSVNGRVLGAPDQAAYDAARQVAINEVAKITSNPTLAGQLSDTARKEVEAFNPASATLKQTVAVFRILLQDMENRTGALDEQIGGIKARISKGTPQSDTAPKFSIGQVVQVGTRKIKITALHADGSFDGDEVKP